MSEVQVKLQHSSILIIVLYDVAVQTQSVVDENDAGETLYREHLGQNHCDDSDEEENFVFGVMDQLK